MGAGRTEVAQAIFGYRKMTKGELFIDGNAVKINNPREAKKRGIGFVTEDRKTQGLVVDFSIKENIAMANFNKTSKSGIIRGSKEKSFVGKLVEKLGVKTPSAELPAKSLSGGNQQKVVIAKWLGIEPEILILDEPTRGVDIGAKKEIYQIMNDLAEQGVAILMISSELPEVIGMSDRVLVMHEGKITGEVAGDDMTQEKIMHYATGGDKVVQSQNF